MKTCRFPKLSLVMVCKIVFKHNCIGTIHAKKSKILWRLRGHLRVKKYIFQSFVISFKKILHCSYTYICLGVYILEAPSYWWCNKLGLTNIDWFYKCPSQIYMWITHYTHNSKTMVAKLQPQEALGNLAPRNMW